MAGLMVLGLYHASFPPDSDAAEPAVVDDGESPAYRKAIKDGVAEYEAQHFEEALSLFRRAHQISPNARTFRGMGMAAFELRDYVTAMRNLSAALRETRKPLSDEQRRQAQALVDRSGLFVDVYSIKVIPRHARVVVDGHAAEFERDGSLLFAFGRHNVQISAPGMEPQTMVVDARGGERKTLSIALSETEERVRSARSVAREGTTSEDHPNRGAKLLIGAGIASALLAGGAGVYWWRESVELDSCGRPGEGKRCTNEGTVRTWRNVAMGTTIGAGVAAVSLTVWGILAWDSAPSPSAVVWPGVVRCVPGAFALTCVGRF